MDQTTARFSVPNTGLALARRTAVGVGVAVVGLLVVQAVVDALNVELGVAGPMTPFAATPLISSTVVAGIGAAIGYAVLAKVTARPIRNFLALATVVFAVMLVPVSLVTPSLAVPLVGAIIGAFDL